MMSYSPSARRITEAGASTLAVYSPTNQSRSIREPTMSAEPAMISMRPGAPSATPPIRGQLEGACSLPMIKTPSGTVIGKSSSAV